MKAIPAGLLAVALVCNPSGDPTASVTIAAGQDVSSSSSFRKTSGLFAGSGGGLLSLWGRLVVSISDRQSCERVEDQTFSRARLISNSITPVATARLRESARPAIGIFTRRSQALARSSGNPCCSLPIRRTEGVP
jgi:hypothetical protein